MKTSVSPAAAVVALIVAVLVVGVGSYWVFFRSQPQVSSSAQTDQTASEQQYEKARPGVPVPQVPGTPGTPPPAR
jgi:hypothetical protein